jgi:hypothetical protein
MDRCQRNRDLSKLWLLLIGATWVTLCEVTDAVTTQKGGEVRTIQTCLTDDGRILQQLLVHRPQYLSRLVGI